MATDKDDFTAIFTELYPGLCRFLDCLLGDNSAAQDIAQESLLRLYRYGAQRLPRGEIRFWVYRVARNLAYNEISKSSRQVRLLERVIALFRPQSAQPSNPEAELVAAEETGLLRELLKNLPADQRTALLLREMEEMSYQQIAAVMGVSESKVKVDIFRGRSLLRERWQAHKRRPINIDQLKKRHRG